MLGGLVCSGLGECLWSASWHQRTLPGREFGAFRDQAFHFSPLLRPSCYPMVLDSSFHPRVTTLGLQAGRVVIWGKQGLCSLPGSTSAWGFTAVMRLYLPFKVVGKLLNQCCYVNHCGYPPQGVVIKHVDLPFQVVPTAWPESSLHAFMG